MLTKNFGCGSAVLSFCFNSAKFGAIFALFGPFGVIFGVGVRFKEFFGTYLHILKTFILEF